MLLVLLAFLGFAAVIGLVRDASPSAAQGLGDSSTLTIDEAVDRTCFERQLDGAAGTDSTSIPGPDLTAAPLGVVEARLAGPPGSDWDVAVFDQAGALVAGASSSGPAEVASGYVAQAGELTVQVCRLSGEGSTGRLSVEVQSLGDAEFEKASLVFVETPRRTDVETLQGLGLDLTEHGGEDYVGVVLHGADDRAALERVGLDYEVQIANLGRFSDRQREADERYAARTARSSLPSGRDTYRRLVNYQQELKDLVEDNPEIVRPITLPHKTWEGRSVEGIEITTDPNNVRDGKPVYLQMGLHHAREWPSGEHAMEWAYELIKGYKDGNARVRNLVEKTRTIVIPVVNPDGFNASREAGEQQGGGGGRDGNDASIVPPGNIISHPNEYRRKNCRFPAGSAGNCAGPALGVAAVGVDPNRNYGAFWGGPGASGDPENETYYGPAPFSEPETKNIRELVSSRQVTVLITNHTFSNLVLRPPGLASEPPPIDDPLFTQLGAAMTAQNGYANIRGFELYDTSGTTEDWSYNTTGGLGYTFEIGCNGTPAEDPTATPAQCTGNFHPTFPKVVAEYEGTSDFAKAVGGKGNREAYFLAHEAAADPAKHSVLEGNAAPGATLKIEKTVDTPTRSDDPASFKDHLVSEMKVPDSGRYEWHLNPSTRPLVAQDFGRLPTGPPAEPVTFSGTPGPDPQPCGDAETTDDTCFNDHAFEVPADATDNDSVTVEIEWGSPASDWDMYVVQDTNGDGVSVLPDGPDQGTAPDSEPVVGSSAQGTTAFESTTFVRPEGPDGEVAAGKYIARVVNFAAAEPYDGEVSFAGPEEFIQAKTETWSFSCTFAGETRVRQDILIKRGERQTPNLAACATGTGPAAKSECLGAKATLVGSKRDDKIVGTKQRDVIVALGGKDKIRSRGGNDLICSKGGNDRLNGGAGKDKIKAGGGRDTVTGGAGNDRIKGGGGPDELSGRGGKDKLAGGGGKDKLRGGGGEDRCIARGKDKATGCE